MADSRVVTLEPDLALTVDDAGEGRPVLVLHGGGGPATVAGIAAHVSAYARAITPTHPGWNGTQRPDRLSTIPGLAETYLRLLDAEGLRDVVLVGSSIGGWLAAELAVADEEDRIGALVLIDAVGVEVQGEPIRDFFALDAREIADYTFHDADRFYVDPATIPAEQAARQRENIATLQILAGDPYMHDPGLSRRLGRIAVPALVIWGEDDRIVTPAYGEALAADIPGARFTAIAAAGHLPQLEQPTAVFDALDGFLGSRTG